MNLTFFEDIDECLDAPCGEGGTCENSEGTYSCTAAAGFTVTSFVTSFGYIGFTTSGMLFLYLNASGHSKFFMY